MRAVSLFSGVEGLGLAVAEVFGAHPVAFAELDPNASKVLAARYPGVPNVGDVTAADWSAFEDVEVVHGGPPCQPFSAAGRRGGMADERWMWPAIQRAVRVVRPRYVVVENVPPLVASDAWGVIVSDLAALGYVGSWLCLRASDVGACHRRERVFLLAANADSEPVRVRARGVPSPARAVQGDGEQRQRVRADDGDGGAAAPDAQGDTWRLSHGDGVRPRSGSTVADADRSTGGRLGPAGGRSPVQGTEVAGWPAVQPRRRGGGGTDGGAVDWGDYAPAIARHAALVGRSAPAPVDERGRLSARFVEWMMCLPAGWVTDVLPRNPALKALGNAVVPPQAVAALRLLRARLGEREAA